MKNIIKAGNMTSAAPFFFLHSSMILANYVSSTTPVYPHIPRGPTSLTRKKGRFCQRKKYVEMPKLWILKVPPEYTPSASVSLLILHEMNFLEENLIT